MRCTRLGIPKQKFWSIKAKKSSSLSQKLGPTLSLFSAQVLAFRLNYKPGPILSQAKLPWLGLWAQIWPLLVRFWFLNPNLFFILGDHFNNLNIFIHWAQIWARPNIEPIVGSRIFYFRFFLYWFYSLKFCYTWNINCMNLLWSLIKFLKGSSTYDDTIFIFSFFTYDVKISKILSLLKNVTSYVDDPLHFFMLNFTINSCSWFFK